MPALLDSVETRRTLVLTPEALYMHNRRVTLHNQRVERRVTR